MGCLLVLVLLVIVLGAGSILAVGFTIGLLLTLIMAGLVGWAADAVLAGRLPGGWVGAGLSGIIGGLIGTWLFHLLGIREPGFELFGIHLIPAFVGAVAIAVGAQMFSSRRALS